MFPNLVMKYNPLESELSDSDGVEVITRDVDGKAEVSEIKEVYPVCAITRDRSKQMQEDMRASNDMRVGVMNEKKETVNPRMSMTTEFSPDFMISRKELISAQKEDESLEKCWVLGEIVKGREASLGYYSDQRVLMRKWRPLTVSADDSW